MTRLLTLEDRTDSQVIASCSPINSANAARPSASVTSLFNRMVASVDPSATVTTRSKAFIFERVRFPDTRNSATRAT